MSLRCSTCGRDLPPEDAASSRAPAWCWDCEQLAEEGGLPDKSAPPRSPRLPETWFKRTPGGFEVGASLNTRGGLIGIVCLGVVGVWALAGLTSELLKLVSMEPQLGQSIIILIPFMGLMLFATLYHLPGRFADHRRGRVIVSVADGLCTVIEGAEPYAKRQQFSWTDAIRIRDTADEPGEEAPCLLISLVGNRDIGFGGTLTRAKREYLLDTIRSQLREREAEPAKSLAPDLTGLLPSNRDPLPGRERPD